MKFYNKNYEDWYKSSTSQKTIKCMCLLYILQFFQCMTIATVKTLQNVCTHDQPFSFFNQIFACLNLKEKYISKRNVKYIINVNLASAIVVFASVIGRENYLELICIMSILPMSHMYLGFFLRQTQYFNCLFLTIH